MFQNLHGRIMYHIVRIVGLDTHLFVSSIIVQLGRRIDKPSGLRIQADLLEKVNATVVVSP